MGWLKIQKLEYLENGTELFYEIKKFLTVSRMTHFKKLSFFSGGDLLTSFSVFSACINKIIPQIF